MGRLIIMLASSILSMTLKSQVLPFFYGTVLYCVLVLQALCKDVTYNLNLALLSLPPPPSLLISPSPSLPSQPHLHQIVLQSMSLANTAPEPCNYFLLLRALFRSIGGGSHEQLYQEFLPLLSNLLQGRRSTMYAAGV